MVDVKSKVAPSVELDRAVAAVAASIGRLAALLDADADVAQRAAAELAKLGPYAAGPMAAALRRSRSPQLTVLLIQLLLHTGPTARAEVAAALRDVLKRERNPYVHTCASMAHTQVAMWEIQRRAAEDASGSSDEAEPRSSRAGHPARPGGPDRPSA